MVVNLDAVGNVSPPRVRTWNDRDVILYALGVGAASEDPTGPELGFVTENSAGIRLQVLPSFAVALGFTDFRGLGLGDFPMTSVVHGEQSFELSAPLPAEGTVELTTTVEEVADRGSGALVRLRTDGTDATTGDKVFGSVASLFIRGEGGFGGGPAARSATSRPVGPEGLPTHVVALPTRADLPLLYRLSGDRTPLHSDPAFARRAGFPDPIMHGLCTFGFACRALVRALGDGDAARIASMSGRFTRPLTPGDTIEVHVWSTPDGADFRTLDGAGNIVIDHGRAGLAPTVDPVQDGSVHRG